MVRNITKTKTVSVSLLDEFLYCGRLAFFQYVAKLSRRLTYDLLCGIQVHRHVAFMHRNAKSGRPLCYFTKKKAMNAWFGRWKRALAAHAHELLEPNDKVAQEYQKTGVVCIAHYWDLAIEADPPLGKTERSYRAPYKPGVRVVGVLDQLRRVPLEWIAAFRPDLVRNGTLAEGYDPVVIVDLKTGRREYDLGAIRERQEERRRTERPGDLPIPPPTPMEEARWQYDLHTDLQPTAYTWLYERVNRRKPVGFLYAELRSGKLFPTYREERDYTELYTAIDHLIANQEAESYPKRTGKHCNYCPFLGPCWEDRPLLIARPGNLRNVGMLETVPTDVICGDHQLRLDLTIPRAKQLTLAVVPETLPLFIFLSDRPWEDPTHQPAREEELDAESEP